jgi:hypothetical protein
MAYVSLSPKKLGLFFQKELLFGFFPVISFKAVRFSYEAKSFKLKYCPVQAVLYTVLIQ